MIVAGSFHPVQLTELFRQLTNYSYIEKVSQYRVDKTLVSLLLLLLFSTFPRIKEFQFNLALEPTLLLLESFSCQEKILRSLDYGNSKQTQKVDHIVS